MNPPFSDREKLPKDYLKNLNEKKNLGKICGHKINLWGYFLALADLMLKPNGKIAAVVPINIARGKATEKIRNYLLKNYHIKYIIKTTKDLAFSENSSFRDILLIAEKKKPRNEDITTIVFLNKSIKDINLDDINKITKSIKSEQEMSNLFEKYNVSQISFGESFMRFISASSLKINFTLNKFRDKIVSTGKLRKIKEEEIKEGFGFRPKGLSKVIVIANPISQERLGYSELILKEDVEKYLIVESKTLKKNIKINKNKTIAALRSLTGIKQIDITKYSDYIIFSNYNEANLIEKFYMHKKINWTKIENYVKRLKGCNVIVPDKINLSSPNTFVISVYSEKAIVPSNMMYLFYTKNSDDSKILCLFLNSVVNISQFILNRPETLGTYFRMRIEDWKEVYILNENSLNNDEKIMLLNLFEKLKNIEIPSILDQFEKRFWAREELDRTILKVLGFSNKEIDEWLPKIYDVIVEELKAIGEVGKTE